jgi:hypothetical protein
MDFRNLIEVIDANRVGEGRPRPNPNHANQRLKKTNASFFIALPRSKFVDAVRKGPHV